MSGYLLDSSALWRLLRDRDLHAAWLEPITEGEFRSCYPQRVEFLRSARNLAEYEQFCAMFADLYVDVAVPKSASAWIGGLQWHAAKYGSHQCLSAVDLQICATAAHHDLIVVHDDADFVTASRHATELRQCNVHTGPAFSPS